MQASGRAVGATEVGGGATRKVFALRCYKPDWPLATSFAGDGRRRSYVGGSDAGNGVALQGDGRIVAVGAGNGEFALARYLGG